MYLVQLFYVNYQPEMILVRADSRDIALAVGRKVTATRGGKLDKQWPGTNGQGVDGALYNPTTAEMKKWPIFKARLTF